MHIASDVYLGTTRSAETAEVALALHAQKVCEAEHGQAHEVFDGEVN